MIITRGWTGDGDWRAKGDYRKLPILSGMAGYSNIYYKYTTQSYQKIPTW